MPTEYPADFKQKSSSVIKTENPSNLSATNCTLPRDTLPLAESVLYYPRNNPHLHTKGV